MVNTACIAPCPDESLVSYDFAEHLKLLVIGGSLEVVHNNYNNLFVQRFIVLPCVRERGITVEIPDHFVDVSVINVCGHGCNECRKGWRRFECGSLL